MVVQWWEGNTAVVVLERKQNSCDMLVKGRQYSCDGVGGEAIQS